MLGYTYPLLNIFWTMFSSLRSSCGLAPHLHLRGRLPSHDMGGFAKALWVIFIIILPLLGVLVYLIARGGKMQERGDATGQTQESLRGVRS